MSELAYEQLTLFPEDSRASRSASLGNNWDAMTGGTCGRKCSGLSANLRRVGSSLRTYLESCDLPGTQFARIWSVKVTASGYSILKLRLLERRTDGSGYSLSPTLAVVKLWPTPMARATGDSPAERQRNTPSLGSAVHMYPMLTTGAGLCGGTGNFRQLEKLKESGVITEDERRSMAQGNGGTLNPTWVEWLMGFPPGWTEL